MEAGGKERAKRDSRRLLTGLYTSPPHIPTQQLESEHFCTDATNLLRCDELNVRLCRAIHAQIPSHVNIFPTIPPPSRFPHMTPL